MSLLVTRHIITEEKVTVGTRSWTVLLSRCLDTCLKTQEVDLYFHITSENRSVSWLLCSQERDHISVVKWVHCPALSFKYEKNT